MSWEETWINQPIAPGPKTWLDVARDRLASGGDVGILARPAAWDIDAMRDAEVCALLSIAQSLEDIARRMPDRAS